jgi:hypothetical protein
MKKWIVLMGMCVAITASAQETLKKDSLRTKPKKISGYYFDLSAMASYGTGLSVDQAKLLWADFTPNGEAFEKNYMQRGPSLNMDSRFSTGISFNTYLGKGEKKKRLITNTGLSLAFLGFSSYRDDISSFRRDTITASGSPDIYLDSIVRQSYHYSASATCLGLDISEFIATNFNKRFSLFGGPGLTTYFSIKSTRMYSYYFNTYSEVTENPSVDYTTNYDYNKAATPELMNNSKSKGYFTAACRLYGALGANITIIRYKTGNRLLLCPMVKFGGEFMKMGRLKMVTTPYAEPTIQIRFVFA